MEMGDPILSTQPRPKRKTRILALLLIAGIMTSAVAATLLANSVVPSHVIVTSQPGLTVFDQAGPITFFEWGDVQQGTSSSKILAVKNSQGSATLWLLAGSINSLTTNPALPPGVSLTWNLAALYPVNNCPEAQPSGMTGCVRLNPSQEVGLTLTLSVSATATDGNLDFTTVFNAYSTSTG